MRRFPSAHIEIMASDTIASPQAAAGLIGRMTSHDIDILVGTQVVSKGYHFPSLTLVGAVDADLGLAGGDLRAAERTFQMLSQVAGRAGRGDRPGRVFLQTYQPEAKVMQALASGDAGQFYETETAERRALAMPPFSRMAALVVSGAEAAAVDRVAAALSRTAPHGEGIEVWGPVPAPLALLRGKHRRRLLLKAARHLSVQTLIRQWLSPLSLPSSVRIQVDIDPYNFL